MNPGDNKNGNSSAIVHNEGSDDSSTVNGEGLVLVLETDRISRQQKLMSIFQTRVLSQCLYVVAESGIANYVSSSTPISVKELAEKLNYDEGNLQRFMSYLASNGIFKDFDDGTFIGTSMSDLLRDDEPGNCRDGIRWAGCLPVSSALSEIETSLKIGGPSFQRATGLPFYEFLAKNPGYEHLFETAMSAYHHEMMRNLAENYDMENFNNVADLGGGSGVLLKEILSRYPTVKKATLFDLDSAMPHVLPELSNEPQFRDRFCKISGNFFNASDLARLPLSDDGDDLFIIMNTMHNYDDADAVKILSNVTSVMKNKASRLLIVEVYANNYLPNMPANRGRCSDLLMMCIHGGKQRNSAVWRQLVAKCNLQLTSGEGTARLEKLQPTFAFYECKLK